MFTIGRNGLVVVCDRCGCTVPAIRDEESRCILPDGWVRERVEEVGTLYCIPIVRSTTICEKCKGEK